MESLALIFGGFIASVITELVKKGWQVKDTTAVLVSYGIALIVTVGGGIALHLISSVSDLLGMSLVIFGTATLVYKLVIKAFGK